MESDEANNPCNYYMQHMQGGGSVRKKTGKDDVSYHTTVNFSYNCQNIQNNSNNTALQYSYTNELAIFAENIDIPTKHRVGSIYEHLSWPMMKERELETHII